MIFVPKVQCQEIDFGCEGLPVSTEVPDPNRTSICTDPEAIRYVPLIFHFLLPDNGLVRNNEVRHPGLVLHECNDGNVPVEYLGLGNFTEDNNGLISGTYQNSLDFGYTGYDRAEEYVREINEMITTNHQHFRKTPGVFYPDPAPEVKVQFVIQGVYFHRDDDAYYGYVHANEPASVDIFNQYGVNTSEAINIFLSPAFNAGSLQGFANEVGGTTKYIFCVNYLRYISGCEGGRSVSRLIYHELGHALGLSHTWAGNDGCEDTPQGVLYTHYDSDDGSCATRRANCWNNGHRFYAGGNCDLCPGYIEVSEPSTGPPCEPCHQWGNYSNNLMDYNGWISSVAITQCQIDLITTDLLGLGNDYVYSCDGCLPAQAFFDLPLEYNKCLGINGVNNYFILDGSGSFNEDEWILELCEIDPNDPTDCLSQTNSAWQSGEIGKVNLLDYFSFNAGSRYEITLRTNNSGCPRDHEFSQEFDVSCNGDPVYTSVEMTVQNPFQSGIGIHYNVKDAGQVAFQLVNSYTYETHTVMPSEYKERGQYRIYYNTSTLSSGMYVLQCLHDGSLHAHITIRQ